MPDKRDHVQFSDAAKPAGLHSQNESAQPGRPFLMITFTCAGAYQRVYRSLDGSHYMARCPKCAKTMRFVVGDGGTNQRAFSVSC